MTVKGFIKKLFVSACIYFSAIMLVYIIIASIINVNEPRLLLEASRVILFFVFAFMLAAANTVYSVKSLSGGLRLVIHFAIMLLAFYTCLMLPLSLRTSGNFVGIVLFSILYFVIFGIWTLIRSRYRKNKQVNEQYKSQFGGK